MNDATTNADALPLPSNKDLLTDVLRQGATQLLAQAIQAEVAAYLEARSHLRDETGRQQVVRNGSLPQRTILTGIGPVEIKQPRVQDRRPAEQREKCRSAILPPYLRKTKSIEELIPWLYLKAALCAIFLYLRVENLGKTRSGERQWPLSGSSAASGIRKKVEKPAKTGIPLYKTIAQSADGSHCCRGCPTP